MIPETTTAPRRSDENASHTQQTLAQLCGTPEKQKTAPTWFWLRRNGSV